VHEEHQEETHQGFTANYQFTCNQITELKSLSVNWFDSFPSSKTINVQFVDESSQKSFILNEQNFNISFSN
jgi:hypothetical protein